MLCSVLVHAAASACGTGCRCIESVRSREAAALTRLRSMRFICGHKLYRESIYYFYFLFVKYSGLRVTRLVTARSYCAPRCPVIDARPQIKLLLLSTPNSRRGGPPICNLSLSFDSQFELLGPSTSIMPPRRPIRTRRVAGPWRSPRSPPSRSCFAVWKSTSASGATILWTLSHFLTMTRPCWLRRAVRDPHRHAIEQASRRWRGGRRDGSARTRRKILISTQVDPSEADQGYDRRR